MDRRAFLGSAVVLGAAAMAGAVHAEAAAAGKGTAGLVVTNEATLGLMAKVHAAAVVCEDKAAACQQHCSERLAVGETDFARCSAAVQQMQAVCAAVGKLAALKSVHLGAMLDACLAACKSCKDACEEHKAHWAHGMHMECKECAGACDGLIAAAGALKTGWKVG
jgi:Cys-rich four helix bundle protein (predicted Tat secretion target)